MFLLGGIGGRRAKCVETFQKQGPPNCPQTRSPCQTANFMQPSSCWWNRERDRDRYYLWDCAETGGNWVETLAMNKSKRYIVTGACFLPPSSLLIYSKGHYPSVFCVPLCFALYVLGGWETWACVCMWHFHISWERFVCILVPRPSWVMQYLWWLFTRNAQNSLQFHVFSTPLFFCQIFVPFSSACQFV